MHRRKLGVVVLLSILLICTSCKGNETEKGFWEKLSTRISKLCSRVDETDLNSVISYYYDISQKFQPKGKYRFLSKRSQKEVTQEQWEAPAKEDKKQTCTIESVFILGEEQKPTGYFAKVSVEYSCSQPDENIVCRTITTHTWIKEENKWRRLLLPKTAENAQKQFSNGDYEAARRAAEKWLEINPFSIDAYYLLFFSSGRNKALSQESRDNIIRAVLAIDPNDSDALFLAATASDELAIAKSFLNKLSNDCSRDSAVCNVALTIQDSNERLSFLENMSERMSLDSAGIILLKAVTLGTLKRYKDVSLLLNEQNTNRIKNDLDSHDGAFAAIWASKISNIFYKSKDYQRALEWLDYAISRDPNNENVIELSRKLDKYRK